MKKIIILTLIVMALVACTNTGSTDQTPTTTPKGEVDLSNIRIVDESYKSEVPYEVIKYTPDSRHYYVQQTDGDVTLETATAIVRELYSKEAYADNGGTIGNVVIYDNTVTLKKGESPNFDILEKAEYDFRSQVIHFDGVEHPFEPAYK